MKAVRYHGPNEALTFEDIPRPSEGTQETTDTAGSDSPRRLPKGSVEIQVQAAALCHTELHFCDGTLNLGVKPITLGHEAVGVIVGVGEGVDSARVGERVIAYYYQGCGDCRWCQEGNEQICDALKAEFGFISDGGLAEYMAIPSKNAIHLPDTISFVDAAPIGCGVTTAVHAAKMAKPKANEWSLVYGVNGVGFGLVQLLKRKYGCKVVCVGRTDSKLEKAKELGADLIINATKVESVAAAVREATGGTGVDTIFECVGQRTTMDQCVGWAGALGKRGRMVMVGYHAGEEHEFRYHPIPMIVYEQSIMGSVGATLEDLREAVQLVADGTIQTIVDSTIPLSQFQDGLDKIKNCNCLGKIVCLPCE